MSTPLLLQITPGRRHIITGCRLGDATVGGATHAHAHAVSVLEPEQAGQQLRVGVVQQADLLLQDREFSLHLSLIYLSVEQPAEEMK